MVRSRLVAVVAREPRIAVVSWPIVAHAHEQAVVEQQLDLAS